MHQTDHLASLIQQWTTDGSLWRLHSDSIVRIFLLEGLCLAHGATLDHFRLTIGQQPDSASRRGNLGGDGEGLRLAGSHTELHHIVHIVGTHDGADGYLLASRIDDDGPRGTLEGGEVTDGLTIDTCEETVAAPDE